MALFYSSIGLGLIVLNTGIYITKSLYNLSYNMIYGNPKNKQEILIINLSEQVNKNQKRIEELTNELNFVKKTANFS